MHVKRTEVANTRVTNIVIVMHVSYNDRLNTIRKDLDQKTYLVGMNT